MSVVQRTAVEGITLSFSGVEMLDRTPLLDSKPFIPAVDTREERMVGWLGSDTD